MRSGPQIDCSSCGFPILLAFVECDGDDRAVSCPSCGDRHTWTIVGRSATEGRITSPRRSSVE